MAITYADAPATSKPTLKLSIDPLSNIEPGKSLKFSMQLDPGANKVCMVAGNLSFSTNSFGNPYLQDIVIAKGIKAQPAPSQSKPHFYLIIPGCTTKKQSMMDLYVTGYKDGMGIISLDSVIIYGTEGKIISYNAKGQEHKISIAPAGKNNFVAALSMGFDSFIKSGVLNIAVIICSLFVIYFLLIFYMKGFKKKH